MKQLQSIISEKLKLNKNTSIETPVFNLTLNANKNVDNWISKNSNTDIHVEKYDDVYEIYNITKKQIIELLEYF